MIRRTGLALAATLLVAPFLMASTAQAQTKDIVDTAVEAGSFNTLAAALGAAGLVETLKGDGPFTVFAPTDEAFAALPAGTVDKLLLPANREALTAVLTYHIVAGSVTASQVMGMSSAGTVNGQEVAVMTHDGKVMINDATVVSADVMATNGVIHVIDKVLLPEGLTLVDGDDR